MIKKKLINIINELTVKEIYGNTDINITGVEYDSRKIKPGNVFVAIKGYREDGNAYIAQAVNSGARAVISSVKQEEVKGIARVVVDDPRAALAIVSGAYYGYPSDKLNVIGITGTNGKTTVSYLVESILSANKEKAGVFGTVGYRMGAKVMPAPNTTPESRDLQELLSKLVEKGFGSAVLEVSSHALAQGRVEGIEFDAAVFTNLTRDHLDFHGSMDNYLDAKMKLFSGLGKGTGKKGEKVAVINNDDAASARIKESIKTKIITYALEKEADITASGIKLKLNGTEFTVNNNLAGWDIEVSLPLAGRFNVYNALASAALGAGRQVPPDIIKKGLEGVRRVPGRFETINEGQPFSVVVDYAHTDDSLDRLLKSCRQLKAKRIITVFGCGGDRDRGKRPLMGEAAVRNSDYVIVTSDNPRTEDPDKIILDIETGMKRLNKDNYKVVKDRKEAIEKAIMMADRGDIVVIAGKGHENYQVLGSRRIHFDDREIAGSILKQMGAPKKIDKNGKNNRK